MISVVIAGSTAHTAQCAQALMADARFQITGIITPVPKPQGRKQELRENPLALFAVEQHIPILRVHKRLKEVQEPLYAWEKPNILLVVDFGYIVPTWLLDWPLIAPVNIHPSALPRFRGSSPGQFSLLFGEQQSAVTIMEMDEKLDHGPIITQLPFPVDPTWTATDYYRTAFELVTAQLADILSGYIAAPAATPQPDDSPTPVARMLHKEDGYIPWAVLTGLMAAKPVEPLPFLEGLGLPTTASQVDQLAKALSPWPGIWTLRPGSDGEKRMKILTTTANEERLKLLTVQMEGKTAQPYTP